MCKGLKVKMHSLASLVTVTYTADSFIHTSPKVFRVLLIQRFAEIKGAKMKVCAPLLKQQSLRRASTRCQNTAVKI